MNMNFKRGFGVGLSLLALGVLLSGCKKEEELAPVVEAPPVKTQLPVIELDDPDPVVEEIVVPKAMGAVPDAPETKEKIAAVASDAVLEDEKGKLWTLVASAGTISLEKECLRRGDYSVAWEPQKGAVLELIQREGESITVKDGMYVELMIYNPKEGAHQLDIDFVDAKGNVCYSFPFLLNYKGWRSALVHYQVMPKKSASGTTYSTIRIRTNDNDERLLFAGLKLHDTMGWWGTGTSLQTPFVPYRKETVEQWQRLMELKPISRLSVEDKKSLKLIRDRLSATIKPWNGVDLEQELGALEAYNIREEERFLVGKPIPEVGRFIRILRNITWAYFNAKDERCLPAVELGLRYLKEQGYAVGSNLECGLAVYAFRDMFTFLPMLNGEIDEQVLADAYACVAWYTGVGSILQRGLINTDWLGMSSKNTLVYAFFGQTDPRLQVAVLKAWRDYMDYAYDIYYGKEDNLKPDGSIYHHEGHYPARYACIAWASLIEQYYLMRGTSYAITEPMYNRVFGVVKAICDQATGRCLPWGISGRSAEPERIGEWVRLPISSFRQLAELGGAFTANDFDVRVAAMSKRIFPNESFFDESAEKPPTGFWQNNYVPSGSYRQKDWLVYFRGMSDVLWGTECYIRDGLRHNVYGYFQGHGSLEVWYPGDAEDNGYRMGGWDYNLPCGATVKRITDPKELDVAADVLQLDGNLKQRNAFCGALAFGSAEQDYFDIKGNYGIYAMDFQDNQDATFRFRKSVFCLNDAYIVALGDHISSTDTDYPLVTSLFQRLRLKDKNAPFLFDGSEVVGEETKVANKSWLLDTMNTGYWVPKGKLQLASQPQEYPLGWEGNETKGRPIKASAAWAYLDHGTAPDNAFYEYVILPGVDAAAMKTWDMKLSSGKMYNVLKASGYHAVQDAESGLVGIAVFEADSELPGGVVTGADQSCLIVYKKKGRGLQLALSNPKISKTGWKNARDSQLVTLTLRGRWKLHQPVDGVSVQAGSGETKVEFVTQYGRRYQAILVQ